MKISRGGKFNNASVVKKYTQKCWERPYKVRFPDKVTALRELAAARSRGREEKRVYECEFCGGWHLTQQKER